MILDLTIVIPVKNEEANLGGCLAAIGNDLARQVVVVDSGSTDQTKVIAQKNGAALIDFVWDGKFPKKRNWYLRNHTPDTKWVLFLDADEHLTEDFKKELRAALAKEDYVGFWLSYTVYFMGKKLRGGYPLRKLALFRVGAGEYERIDEDQWSRLDMEVHEHPVLQGQIGLIRSKIDHRDLRDVGHYMHKHNEYASWETARYYQHAGQLQEGARWTWKQKLKYRLMNSPLIGPAYFFGSFLLLGGFRDGARGLAFAILKMSYFTQIYCRLQERAK
ncbi:glycosyltransferase family 2 protein [Paraflavisolibacter sp. H34]|uniref:glycosyltransferase family 2 protein n=1 Tax=Huijunlia imazamoxiresistens TaxID=3127457 RepID=UPI003017989A